MTAVDGLMLDAKQAIMEEHLRRFHILQQEGRWQEALQQIQVTLSCTTDLLNESLRVLDEFLEPQDGPATDDSPPLTERYSSLAPVHCRLAAAGCSRRLTG